jgi:hypothetical protein
MRTSNKIKAAEDSAKAAIKEAETKVTELRADFHSEPATAGIEDDPGLLRIKDETGSLTLDLDGTRVDPTTLAPEQRKRLIGLLNAIRPWLEGKPASAPPAKAPPPAPAPVPAPDISSPPKPAAQTPVPPSKKKADEPEAAPTSIVGQINLILQARIAKTPLASRGVTMLESPSGGVYVYMGVNKYEGVDEVPDEEIKNAIREAIAEWERKYTPGL